MDYLHTGATLGASPLDVASLERLTGIPRASLVVVPAGATRFVFDARLLEAGMPPPAPDPFRATPPPPPLPTSATAEECVARCDSLLQSSSDNVATIGRSVAEQRIMLHALDAALQSLRDASAHPRPPRCVARAEDHNGSKGIQACLERRGASQ